MKKRDLEFLRCPDCFHRLDLDASEGTGSCVFTGQLTCSGCSRRYPIHTGVAMLSVIDKSWEPMLREIIARVDISRQLSISGFEKDRALDAVAGNEANLEVMSDLFTDAASDIEIREGMRVLDVGAGLCGNSEYFAGNGAEVVAQDVDLFHLQYPVFRGVIPLDDESRAALAKGFVAGNYFGRVYADVHRLPYEDATFDLTFCRSTMHHLESRFRAVKEMARVTRPGGRLLFISEPVRSVLDSEMEYLEGIFDYEQGLNEQTPLITSYTLPMVYACHDIEVLYSRPGCMERTRRFLQHLRIDFDKHFHDGERLGFVGSFKLLLAGCGVNVAGTRSSRTIRKPGRVHAGRVVADVSDLVVEFTEEAADSRPRSLDGFFDDHPYAIYGELRNVPREQRERLRKIHDSCLDPWDFPESIEFGGACDRFIRGWRQPEHGPGVDYRYSGRMAVCRLRNVLEAENINMLVGTFLAEAGKASGVIRVNGEEAFRFDIPPGVWREISFRKPRIETGVIEVEIENLSTFIPDEIIGSGDTRELGLPVSRIWQA